MRKISFFGESAKLAEIIFFNHNFELKAIFCDKNKINNDLLTFSYQRKISLFKVENNLELLQKLNRIESDIVLMCGFGIILNQQILNRVKVYNVHPGKLPDYKGRHPTFHATINGDKTIFFTLHEVVVEIDSGKIIDEVEMPYYFWQNEFDVQKYIIVAFEKLIKSLLLYFENKIIPKPNSKGKYYPKVERKDKILNTEYPIDKLLNIIRAQAPFGGAIFLYKNQEYLVSRAEIQVVEKNFKIEQKIVSLMGNPLGISIDKNHFLKFLKIVEFEINKN